MLERLTGKLLSRFLSKYFILPDESTTQGSSSSSSPSKTQLAVWSGFLSYQHLQLRTSIVNDVFAKKGLPFELCSGFIDRVEITVPWGQLRSLLSGTKAKQNTAAAPTSSSDAEIVIVLDGLYVLLNTRYEFHDDKLKESQRVQRRHELDEAMAYVANNGDTAFNNDSSGQSNTSYFSSYVKNRLLSETFLNEIFDTLTNEIQIHLRNVHVRMEDMESDPWRPCCFGFTLESLHLTTSEDDNHTTNGAVGESGARDKKRKRASLEKILARKVLQVNQLSIYCNGMDDDDDKKTQDGTASSPSRRTTSRRIHLHSEVLPLQTMKDTPLLLSKAMHTCIPRRNARSSLDGNRLNNNESLRHVYLLYPVDATSSAVLSKPSTDIGRSGYNKAKLRSETTVANVQLGVHPSTVGHLTSFHARLKHHKSLLRHRFNRPTVSILSHPRLWWKYIVRVVRRELREAGNVTRGGWSWVRWYDRIELRNRYMSLYDRWLDHGVVGEDVVMVDEARDESVDEETAVDEESTCRLNAALAASEYEEMQAIENATIEDEVSVKDILLFRAMVHSKRQKQAITAKSFDNTADSQYRLTRFLRRIVTSEDVDEEYARLLSYLEKKEEEEEMKRKEEEQESARYGNSSNSDLCVVISMETIIREGSLSLFSDRGRIFDVALSTIQSKISVLENFDSVIVEASIHDCMGLEFQATGPEVVFSRSIHCEENDGTKYLDKLLLPVDFNFDTRGNQLQWSHYDSPLFEVNFTRHPLDAETDASISLSFQKMKVLVNVGFDWPQRCKEAFVAPSNNRSMSTEESFWEDISVAYINSWESTKKSLAVKVERALQKQRKLDVSIDVHSPIVFVSDGADTTIVIDLGHAHLSTLQLAGVRNSTVRDYHNDTTPKKTNTSTPALQRHTRNSSESRGYLFTPNKRGTEPSTFLSPAPNSISRGALDISSIYESPYDTSSLNGSIESAQRRNRGWSIGNSKLFSVAENEETTVAIGAPDQHELIKCLYDNYFLGIDRVVVSISTSNTNENVFELPAVGCNIGKSTIPSDHSLCKLRLSFVMEVVRLNLSKESIFGIQTLYSQMKSTSYRSGGTYNYSRSHIFPSLSEPIKLIPDDDSFVNEDEFLDAISEPDDANQWFNEHWLDDESVGDFTYDRSFARTPSRRHRFPSISEVSGEEARVYLSADNLQKLDDSLDYSRRRSRSYSQISGDEDSFQSAVSNQDEIVKAIQEDIYQCESDIALLKDNIQRSVEIYKENWRTEDANAIKHRRHHKRRLKAQLLRLEAELNALKACYREIVAAQSLKPPVDPHEDSIVGPDFDAQAEALDRAKALVIARKMRVLYSTTKSAPGHHTLTKLNRDLLFVSISITSLALVVTECDQSVPRNEREAISLHFGQFSASAHRRQLDTRLRIGLDSASASAPGIGAIVQCGHLNESAVARQAVKVEECCFIRAAAEIRKNKSLSKVKLKMKVGSTELAAHSIVYAAPILSALHKDQQQKPTRKHEGQASDPMMKLVSAIMGSSDTTPEATQIDIDIQIRSLHISIADYEDLSLLSLSGMQLRLARRIQPSQSRGQVDFGLDNIQLHEVSNVGNAREFFGCQSTFDRFVQGRIRIQSSNSEETGGWCVEMDQPNSVTVEDNVEQGPLFWNVHVGVRCPSTIIFLMSPDIPRIASFTKGILSRLSPKKHSVSPNSTRAQECNGSVEQSNLPIRWRLDYSMLECDLIIPGKDYSYTSSMYYDAGEHLRISNSIRLCVHPNQQMSGNVCIGLTARTHAILNAASSTNIIEPFTLSFNVITSPHIVKMQPRNTNSGALDTPKSWTAGCPSTDIALPDELDVSISMRISALSFYITHRLFLLIKEASRMRKRKKVNHEESEQATHVCGSSTTKQGSHISFDLETSSVSLRLPDDKTSFLVEAMKIRFISDAQHISTTVSAGEIGLFYANESLILPVIHSTPLMNDAWDSFQTTLLLTVKQIKSSDDQSQSFEVFVKAGSFYITTIPSFMEEFIRQQPDVEKRTQTHRSQECNTSMYPVKRLKELGSSTLFTFISDGLNLVFPSQDVHQLHEQRNLVLNTICFSLSKIRTTLSLEVLDVGSFYSSSGQESCNSIRLKEIVENERIESEVALFKCDAKARCCLTRTEFILTHKLDQSVGLTVVAFQRTAEQTIISPFPYNFITSVVIMTDACSVGIHLDIGCVDVLWHIAKSTHGLSDALELSIMPLFRKDKPKKQPVQPSQTKFESLSLQLTSPIQQIDSCQLVSSQARIPERVAEFLKDMMIVFSIRTEKILITCVPSNAKEVSSPIMNLKLNSIRIGASMLRCPSADSTSCIYFAPWCDLEVGMQYHNRRLVVYEPFIEAWSMNIQACINISEALGINPYIDPKVVSETPGIPAKSDANRFAWFLEEMKHFHKRNVEGIPHEHDSPTNLPTELDVCHIIQCSITPRHLERAIHPAGTGALHIKDGFIQRVPSKNDVSAALSLSGGKAGSHPEPLNINVTGALIENIGLVLSERSDSIPAQIHISPHYIVNLTGLTMRWKPDGQSTYREIHPGDKEELSFDSFPHRSFIHVQLYNSQIKFPILKAMAKIDVDMVGTKRYSMKRTGKLTENYVIVRTQLIGTAKVVSVESSLWVLNASSTPIMLTTSDGNVLNASVLPRSDTQQNNIPQNATPLPVDTVCQINENGVRISAVAYDQQPPVTVLYTPFSAQKEKIEDTQILLPISMYQSVSLRACSFEIGLHQQAAPSNLIPGQRLIVLQSNIAFRNCLPYSVVYEVKILRVERTKENEWVNIGEIATGQSIDLPFVKNEETIEFRIKIMDLSDWSSSVCLSPEDKESTNKLLVLSDRNGITLQISVGVQVNDAVKDDTCSLLDHMKSANSAHREIFIHVPLILVDCTGQSLEFRSDNVILRQQGTSEMISHIDVHQDRGLLAVHRDKNISHDAAVYMIGGKTSSFAIRQSTRPTQTSSWSAYMSIAKGKTRIIVPRPSQTSHPLLILCASVRSLKVLGERYTRVVTLENQYNLVNHLPIDIDVISTKKSGLWLKREPLIVPCNSYPVPLHFDDNGFIRLRPKEIGWSYSGFINVRSNSSDIAMRLRNKLTGKALIITIEYKKNGLSLNIIIRRSRAVPFRIENLSTVPLEFAQQRPSILGIFNKKWDDSTILLPYHQADYAWDELECNGNRHISVAVADLDFGRMSSCELGRFHLDILAPGSIVATHPMFNAEYITDGPTRVLKITNSTLAALPEETALMTTRRLNYRCSLCIDVGVSLVDWKPEELVYIYLGGLTLNRHVSSNEDLIQCSASSFSTDCCLWNTKYPVLFKMKETKSGKVLSISWCRDTNDALGKDITLLRHASIELGKLVLKIDGSLATSLLSMSRMASKLLRHQEDNSAYDVNNLKRPNYGMTSHLSRLNTAANAAKEQLSDNHAIAAASKHSELGLPHRPKHKYYIEQLKISSVRAEISYCGRTFLPLWLSPAFMFESLPVRFSSYSSSYGYGSASEHLQSIKQHYSVWRFLFGLSLRPMFIARAVIFTTKQSISVLYQQALVALRSVKMIGHKSYNESVPATSILASPNVASTFLQESIIWILSCVVSLSPFFNYGEHDERVRAPRSFARLDNADVLLEYAEGENKGRNLLSKVQMGQHLSEGCLYHGDLRGIGVEKISSYDASFFFILTSKRLLILKKSAAKDAPAVFWDVELQNIVLIETDELPLNKLSVQIFHSNQMNMGLGALSSKLLLFSDSDTGKNLVQRIKSISKGKITLFSIRMRD